MRPSRIRASSRTPKLAYGALGVGGGACQPGAGDGQPVQAPGWPGGPPGGGAPGGPQVGGPQLGGWVGGWVGGAPHPGGADGGATGGDPATAPVEGCPQAGVPGGARRRRRPAGGRRGRPGRRVAREGSGPAARRPGPVAFPAEDPRRAEDDLVPPTGALRPAAGRRGRSPVAAGPLGRSRAGWSPVAARAGGAGPGLGDPGLGVRTARPVVGPTAGRLGRPPKVSGHHPAATERPRRGRGCRGTQPRAAPGGAGGRARAARRGRPSSAGGGLEVGSDIAPRSLCAVAFAGRSKPGTSRGPGAADPAHPAVWQVPTLAAAVPCHPGRPTRALSSPTARLALAGLAPEREEAPHGRRRLRCAEELLEEVVLLDEALPPVGFGRQRGLLGQRHGLARVGGHAGREVGDVGVELLGGGEGAVQVAPALGGGGVEVDAAEDQLHRPAPTQQPGQPLGPGAARQDADRHLHLVDDRAAEHAEAHVAGGGDLGAAPADPARDLGDGRLRHRPEPLAHLVERVQLLRTGGIAVDGEAEDRLHVEVGDEELGVGRLQDDHPDLVVGGGPRPRTPAAPGRATRSRRLMGGLSIVAQATTPPGPPVSSTRSFGSPAVCSTIGGEPGTLGAIVADRSAPAPPTDRSTGPPGALRDRPAGYPARWESDVVLADGGTVHVRPIRPDDIERMVAFHGRQSAESIYFRYFSSHPRLSDRELKQLTEVDYRDRMALVAILGDDLVAVGRYEPTGQPGTAEGAFFVDDGHHGRGLATLLLEYLVVAAREGGYTKLIATVLPHNSAMLATFRQAGFGSVARFADGVVEVAIDLQPTSRADAAIAERERRADARLGGAPPAAEHRGRHRRRAGSRVARSPHPRQPARGQLRWAGVPGQRPRRPRARRARLPQHRGGAAPYRPGARRRARRRGGRRRRPVRPRRGRRSGDRHRRPRRRRGRGPGPPAGHAGPRARLARADQRRPGPLAVGAGGSVHLGADRHPGRRADVRGCGDERPGRDLRAVAAAGRGSARTGERRPPRRLLLRQPRPQGRREQQRPAAVLGRRPGDVGRAAVPGVAGQPAALLPHRPPLQPPQADRGRVHGRVGRARWGVRGAGRAVLGPARPGRGDRGPDPRRAARHRSAARIPAGAGGVRAGDRLQRGFAHDAGLRGRPAGRARAGRGGRPRRARRCARLPGGDDPGAGPVVGGRRRGPVLAPASSTGPTRWPARWPPPRPGRASRSSPPT